MLSVVLSSIQSIHKALQNKDLYPCIDFLGPEKAGLSRYKKSGIISAQPRRPDRHQKELRNRRARCISIAAHKRNSRYNTGAGFNDYPEGVFDSRNFSS